MGINRLKRLIQSVVGRTTD